MDDAYRDVITAYSKDAEVLARKYSGYDRSQMFPLLETYLTPRVQTILDIGAGNGVDALNFAQSGRRVVAVEPSNLIDIAAQTNNHANITWIRDALPDLVQLQGLEGTFDLVFLNRVFMHVPPADQRAAIQRLTDFIRPGGTMYMIVRHGPSFDDRPMYTVDIQALQLYAQQSGLACQDQCLTYPDFDGRAEISWSLVVFTKS